MQDGEVKVGFWALRAILVLVLASGCVGGSAGGGGFIPGTYDTVGDGGDPDGAVDLDALQDGDTAGAADSATDAAPSDTGPLDADPTDTGLSDTGPSDTGPTDAGPTDAGPTDTGPTDTGPTDTGPTDTGPTDTGPTDTGSTDAGPTDTGPTDAGPTDTGPGGCKGAADCDDGDPCTNDACALASGLCAHDAIAGCGKLSAPCSSKFACQVGVCDLAANACVACLKSADCGAGQFCKANACLPAPTCKSDVDCKATSQVCSLGDGVCVDCNVDADCGANQACSLQGCIAAPPCASSKECSKVCDTKAGKCVECNSSNDCQGNQYCGVGKVCRPKICLGPACNGLQLFLCRADGSGYDVGASCSDGNPCTDDACDAATGCTAAPNAKGCDDGNACTSSDACKDKSCAGAAIDCDDGKPCTQDSCSTSSGCKHTNTSAGCDDGNACTLLDACSGGACKGGSQVNCDDSNPCTTDTCDPKSGCKLLPNTAGCSDGDACTSGDACSGGVCKGSAVVCNDSNPCTDDSCGQTGCQHPANFKLCDDGSVCTTSDACSQGACKGNTKSCDDFNSCTADSCDKVKGCQNLNAPGGSCNDGDACTSSDACSNGGCKGSAITCDDKILCTDDGCAKSTGCTHVANTKACDDDNVCTEADVCANKSCVASGKVKDCDDKDGCTLDSCDKVKGCTYLSGVQKCDDGNPCTTDSCAAPVGTCKHEQKASCCTKASDCDDGKPCTKEGCMTDGSCKVVSDGCCTKNEDCKDGQLCTTETCASGECKASEAVPCPGLVTHTWDFEDGSPQLWTLSAPNATYGIGWSVLSTTGGDGQKSLALGKPGGEAFADVTGTTLMWSADSPEVKLAAGRAYKATVVWKVDVKASISTYNRIDLRAAYSTTTVLKASRLYTQTGWQTDTFAIDELAGATFKLRLEARLGATTSSSLKASGTGFVIDSVRIADAGPAKTCKANADCGNPAACASGTCVAGACSYEAKCCTSATQCDDGKPCTTDSCSASLCLHTPKANCCASSAQCDDGKACTLDVCNNPAAPTGGTCSSTPGYGCCASAADCKATTSPCFAAACSAGMCSYTSTCCTTAAECNDGDPTCTTDACVNGKCQFTPTNAPGCCVPTFVSEGFEAGVAAGWSFSNSAGSTKGWQIWTAALYPTSGKAALYYGDPLTKSYDFGSSSGTATYKATLPAAAKLTASMSIRLDTESSTTYDQLTISVMSEGVSTTVWTKSSTYVGKHAPATFDLSKWAGKPIELRLLFTTVDGVNNTGAGVHVDDVLITRSCP